MKGIERWIVHCIVFLFAGYLALAQPGLPACWLQANACASHPHFSKHHEQIPHTHDYLKDMTQATIAGGIPVVLIPVILLIRHLCQTLLVQHKNQAAIHEREWNIPPDYPPPRVSISF